MFNDKKYDKIYAQNWQRAQTTDQADGVTATGRHRPSQHVRRTEVGIPLVAIASEKIGNYNTFALQVLSNYVANIWLEFHSNRLHFFNIFRICLSSKRKYRRKNGISEAVWFTNLITFV